MRRIEWAVIQPVFRDVRVIKEGLASQEEAEKWLDALTTTRQRTTREHFEKTDGIVIEKPYEIAWRSVDHWHSPDEESPE